MAGTKPPQPCRRRPMRGCFVASAVVVVSHRRRIPSSLLFAIAWLCVISFVSASGEGTPPATDLDFNLFHQDYSPPSPPPPSPLPQPVSCEDDLKGNGSLDTTCELKSDLELAGDVYIQGKGNFYILPGINVYCLVLGCSITVNVSGNFSLGENASIVTGTLALAANSASFLNGSVVNTTGMAGSPPPETSGTPQGVDGAGGGHGGRGACCLIDKKKLPEDMWGGDAYAWATLRKPTSYGSKGGTTSKEVDYGGGGGGRIKFEIVRFLVIEGSVLADGGDGGSKGGGGSGGSIFIKAYRM